MITQKFAKSFAEKWVSAWNSHDIDEIIVHYADNVDLIFPIAEKLLGNPKVSGIDAV